MAKRNSLAQEISREGETVSGGTPQVTFLGAEPNPTLVTNVRLVEDIAKSNYCVRNINFPEAEETFPLEPQNQTIEIYFPLAEGGPLYVDNCAFEDDAPVFAKKQKIMKKHGLRYLVLKKDTDMVDAENQLRVN